MDNGLTYGWMYVCMVYCSDLKKDEWMNGSLIALMNDEAIAGWTDGWTNDWLNL